MEQQKDNVGAKHPDYDEAYTRRKKYKDVLEGGEELREHHRLYLPKFPNESDASYQFRVDTLTHFNLTKKTRDVMTGLVFKNEIELSEDVPSQIVKLTENIDNAGTHLDVFARKVLERSFEGYCLILTDAPSTTATSLEEEQVLKLRPYFKLYDADAIWNWSYKVNPISKATELELMVLREVSNELAGMFRYEKKTRFRVFRQFGGLVTWELYLEIDNKDSSKEKDYILEDAGTLPKLSQIPVAVIGCLGNDSPLLDIANKNLEHTQTYSDYKSIIHKTCVPMLYLQGISAEEAGTKTVSGDFAWALPENGSIGFAEVQGSGIEATRQTLLDIREDVSLMGLSLLANKTVKTDLTATEALLNNIGETAELRVLARELQDAIELSFGHLAEYLGKPRVEGGSVVLGSAWNMSEMEASSVVLPNGMTLAEFDARLNVVNKAKGLIPMDELIRMLMGEDVEESVILDYIAKIEAENQAKAEMAKRQMITE